MSALKYNKKYLNIGIIIIILALLALGIRKWSRVREGVSLMPRMRKNTPKYGLDLPAVNFNFGSSGTNINLNQDFLTTTKQFGDSINEKGNAINSGLASILEELEPDDDEPEPAWNDLYDGNSEMTTPVSIIMSKPDHSLIINDSCSSKGFLVSDYEEDICEKYKDDYDTLNEKCGKLTEENCVIPECCILLNGNKCVAGNAYGPTFLTKEGKEIDYKFYNHKTKCYGNCDMTNNDPLPACDNYADNSTGVSRQCMLQIYNSMGCPYIAPDTIINDSIVHKFSRSSRRYITNYLAEAVRFLKKNIETDDARVLCFGPTKICDKYKDNDVNVSKECMVEMLTEANCPNKTADAITPQDMTKYSSIKKANVRFAMNICDIGKGA